MFLATSILKEIYIFNVAIFLIRYLQFHVCFSLFSVCVTYIHRWRGESTFDTLHLLPKKHLLFLSYYQSTEEYQAAYIIL